MAMIRTVTGDHIINEGMCLIHEHVQIDLSHNKSAETVLGPQHIPAIISDLALTRDKFSLNLIAEMSVVGSGRDVTAMRDVSLSSGVHIIASTGYYWEPIHPANENGTLGELTDFMVKEITEGADDTSIRCGVIKIGTDKGDIPDSSLRIFQAAAQASRLTGASIVTHTSTPDQAQWQIDILAQAGADLSQVLISHLHGFKNRHDIYHHARRGVKIGFDQIGFAKGLSYDEYADLICAMMSEGFTSQLMISSDMARHARLSQNGGTSYATVFAEIVPRLKQRGVSEDIIVQILSHNPLTFLSLHV